MEWIKARAGIPTASSFDRIITAGGKLSAQSREYMHDLAAERILGVSLDNITSEWMERGKAMEEAARDYYQFQTDADVVTGGFCLRDDRSAGCSPDGLVGDDGGVEIKCPGAGKHIGYLIGGELPAAYRCQVQGSLWVTGRAWWDFLSYNPSLPSVIVRVHRDDAFIAALSGAVVEFSGQLEAAMGRLRDKGLLPPVRASRVET